MNKQHTFMFKESTLACLEASLRFCGVVLFKDEINRTSSIAYCKDREERETEGGTEILSIHSYIRGVRVGVAW